MRRILASIATALLVVSGSVAFTATAASADTINATVGLTKSAQETSPSPDGVISPGEEFRYLFNVSCGTSAAGVTGCKTATVTDLLPDYIEYIGTTFPSAAPGVATVTDVGGRDNVSLVFTSNVNTPDPTTGLPLGSFEVAVDVRLASDAPWELDGQTITNTADITAANSAPGGDTADIIAAVPMNLATSTGKSFSPDQNYNFAGETTTLTLSATNDTNGGVDTLTVQDVAGAAPLPEDASNPLFYLEFTDFAAVPLPAGAEEVTAEVYDAATDAWVTVYSGAGPPVYPAAGPGIPATADIFGVRFTFTDTDGNRIPAGTSASAGVELTQRANTDGLPATTLDNTVQSTVTVGPDSASSPVVTEPYNIIAFGLQVTANKQFDADQIRAGESSTVRVGATNTGTATLLRLVIEEPGAGTPGALSGELTFAGFGTVSGGAGDGIEWPAGATGVEVVYFYSGGDSGILTTTVADTIPAFTGPQRVTGFRVTFTGGPMPSGAEAKTPFIVDADRPVSPPDLVTVDNDVDVTGRSFTNITLTATDTATDTLEIYGDRIALTVSKSITPSESYLLPGQEVTAQVPAVISAFPDTTINPTQVIVEDSITTSPDWWNLYNAVALPQLSLYSNASLTVQYTTDGSSWTDLPGAIGLVPPAPPAAPYATIAIPSGLQDTIVGLRFVYDATDLVGFPPGSTFQPNITFSTRTETRSGGIPIRDLAVAPDEVVVGNCAAAEASEPSVTAATASTTPPCPTSTLIPVSGEGPDLVDKDLTPSTAVERSQDGANAVLNWSTGGLTGVTQMSVTETGSTGFAPATAATMDTSFFDAFDLISLAPITKTTDPLIAYDTLASVELFDYTAAGGAGAWVAISGGPWDGPTSGNTVFPGYVLTDAERATTTGVRYVFEESPNRASALTPGDLNQPAVGSGVATSGVERRPITLNFQLRDDRRGDGTPVLANELYNTGDASVVRNTVEAAACFEAFVGTACGDGRTTRDHADITILNATANISTSKSWTDETGGTSGLGIPATGTDQADYPSTRMTLNVENNGPQKVDTLILTDPAPNVAFDGTTFDVFTLTNIETITAPVGATTVDVYLEHASGVETGPFTSAEALAMTSAQLATVVGIRIEASGRISASSSGNHDGRLHVVLDAQLRERLRSDPTVAPTPGTVQNTMFGSLTDPSVEPAGSCAPSTPAVSPGANTVIGCSSAQITLTDTQERTVTANKTFAPTFEYENTQDAIRMLLTGRPAGTARSNQVVITDTSADFWNAYHFGGLVDVNPNRFAIVSPANRVKIELLTGATYTVEPDNSITVTGGTWNTVTHGATQEWMTAGQARAALPAGGIAQTAPIGSGTIAYGDVQGVRFTYQRVDSAEIADPNAMLLLFENPATPTLTANLFVQRRDALLTGGVVPTTLAGNSPAPGTSSAGVYPNEVTADATGVPGNGSPATDSTSTDFTFRHLPTEAELVKTPTGPVQPGQDFEVTLATTNSGDYPIIDPVITDILPSGGVSVGLPDFIFPDGIDPTDPANYTFTLTGGSAPGAPYTTMPIDPADVTIDITWTAGPGSEPLNIEFTFPSDTALGLGQTYTIAWDMRLRPGASAHQNFTNAFDLTGERSFDACNGTAGVVAACLALAEVTTVPLAALSMYQEVRAIDPALGVVSTDASTCTTADASADGFYRAPCAPVTKPGQNNEWRLNVQNIGTFPLDTVSTIVYLPNPGLSGITAPSATTEWRPELTATSSSSPNSDYTVEIYYSTQTPGSALCTDVVDGGTCAPGDWTLVTPSTDLSAVTALYARAVANSPAVYFQPGQYLQVTWQTVAPAAAVNPGTDPIAWNSAMFGGEYTDAGAHQTLTAFEVPVVGAALASGSIQLTKTVAGPAAGESWVPTEFTGHLECTSAGEDVPASAIPAVPTLHDGDTVQIDGLPWGAECAFVEDDAGAAVSLSPATVIATDDPGLIQTQTVTNTYAYASLEIDKVVTYDPLNPPVTIPTDFEVSVLCTYLGNVVLDIPDTSPLLLDDGESWNSRTDGGVELPAGAECVVTETENHAAASTVTSVEVIDPTAAPSTDQVTRTATIPELSADAAGAATQNFVHYENLYDVTGLVVTKEFEGEGADQFGLDQTFLVDVVCVHSGSPVLTGTAVLSAANGWTDSSNAPLVNGTECFFEEQSLEGADAVVITPNDGSDTSIGYVLLDGTEDVVNITVTNWYLTGSLQVTKTFDGAASGEYGNTIYLLRLFCERSGTTVDIPSGQYRFVTQASPIANWTNLPTGADCTLTEPYAGGAGESVILPSGDEAATGYTFTVTTDPTILSVADQPQTPLIVQNTFNYAQVSVTKTVDAGGAVDGAGTPIEYGPFDVTLACTFRGVDVTATEPMTQSISDGDTVTWTGLPEGAECTVTESDTMGAASTAYVVTEGGTTGASTAGTSVSLDPLPAVGAGDQTSVAFTNTYESGQLVISKELDGDAAGHVTRTFPVSVECVLVDASHPHPGQVVRDVDVTIGGPADLTATVANLPQGSVCTVTETDDGTAGATSITATPSTGAPTTVDGTSITVDLTVDEIAFVITNTFEYASIEIDKTVTVPDPPGTVFPVPTGFEYSISCTFDGATVLNTTFTLDDGDTQRYEDLPARAECIVTETDPREADSTVTSVNVIDPTVAPSVDQPTRVATIPELSPDTDAGATQNFVSYENLYDLVALVVTKDLEGAGAAQFGEPQTFTVDIVCTFAGETLVNTSVDLSASNAWSASVTGLIAGSECTVTEPDLQGADAVVITPNDGVDTTTGVVTLPDTGVGTVAVTNWYLTGSLEVTKVFAGAAAAQYGTADFELQLSCVRDAVAVDIPGGDLRTVNASSPTALWTNLPTGSECTLSETSTGGAGSTAILDATGGVLVADATAGYDFTVTTDPTILSVDDQPQPGLQVQNTFNYAEVTVSKVVNTDAVDANGDPVEYGPFQVLLGCVFDSRLVTADQPMLQTITDGETFTWTGLPEGADCIVAEVDTAGVTSVVHWVIDGGIPRLPRPGSAADLDPLPAVGPTGQTSVLYVNSFAVGQLVLSKSLAGTGAADVSQSFSVDVSCVLIDDSHPAPGLAVVDETVTIGGPSDVVASIVNVPLGAACTVTEPETGGAASTTVTVTPYTGGGPDSGGTAGTAVVTSGTDAAFVLASDVVEIDVENTFVKPLPPTGGLFAWGLPLGGLMLVCLGAIVVIWRRNLLAD
ncbi:hypothetical protein GCM10009808_00290 [Microbacterium sediminicola]|uniref:DUF5979 domain-containing protein n=2 Tax=Microbacterium sediminicola TaxID=415210 RepID=A0ABN2HFR1_9MICO